MSRFNVQFNDYQKGILKNIANRLGMTKAGVLKTALLLLEVALRENDEGNVLGIVKGGKVIKEIILLDRT